MKLRHIGIIEVKWSYFSGFIFSILSFNIGGEKIGFEGAFFGIKINLHGFIVQFCFFEFQIRGPFLK